MSPKELDWLDKFTGEYYGASFNEDDSKNIQSKEKYKKDCEDRNNARNRDTYSIVKNRVNVAVSKALVNYDDIVNREINPISNPEGHNPRNLENNYIDFIEGKQIEAMLFEYDIAMKNFNEEISEYPEPWQPGMLELP